MNMSCSTAQAVFVVGDVSPYAALSIPHGAPEGGMGRLRSPLHRGFLDVEAPMQAPPERRALGNVGCA